MGVKEFYIITNRDKDPDMKATLCVEEYLMSKGCAVKLAQEGAPGENTDLILVLGGDGTLIRAAREALSFHIPIMGINIGTLGYLADSDLSGFKDSLNKYLSGDYELDRRMMLETRVIRNGEVIYESNALNDVVLNRHMNLSVMQFDVLIDNDFLTSYTADGVICCTATGSTAYSLSAGGPIIQPNARMLMITPICAHSLTGRSIIFDESAEITFRLVDRNGTDRGGRGIWCDGDFGINLTADDEIKVRASEEMAVLVRTDRCGFVQRLRQKM